MFPLSEAAPSILDAGRRFFTFVKRFNDERIYKILDFQSCNVVALPLADSRQSQ